MNYITLPLLAAIPLLLVFVFGVAVPRFRMARRARALLADYPNAERTSVYLELHSMFAGGKKREIDAKIAELQPQGWTYLRAMEGSLLRTMRSRGGGLTLQFIRTKV